MIYLITLYVLPMLIGYFALAGTPKDDGLMLVFLVVPGLNLICYLGIIDIFTRTRLSKGECFLGHSYKMTSHKSNKKSGLSRIVWSCPKCGESYGAWNKRTENL